MDGLLFLDVGRTPDCGPILLKFRFFATNAILPFCLRTELF